MKQEKSKETNLNQETVLANSFAKKYYGNFSREPEVLHKFYKELSTVTISTANKNGVQDSIKGPVSIQEAFIKLGLNGTKITLSRMNIQQSQHGLLFLSIQGVMSSKSENKSNKFTQSFILARQENGFFILNDIFHLFEDEKEEGSPETKQDVLKEEKKEFIKKEEKEEKKEEKTEKKTSENKTEKKEVEKKTPENKSQPEKKKKEEKKEEKTEEKNHDPNQPLTYASIVGTVIAPVKEEKKTKSENGEKKKAEKKEEKKEKKVEGKEKDGKGERKEKDGKKRGEGRFTRDGTQRGEGERRNKDGNQRGEGRKKKNPGPTIYVSGLPKETTNEDLQKCFESCGKIVEVVNKGPEKGYGFIVFEDEKSFDSALSPKSVFKIKDSVLKVEKRAKNPNKKSFHKKKEETKETKEKK